MPHWGRFTYVICKDIFKWAFHYYYNYYYYYYYYYFICYRCCCCCFCCCCYCYCYKLLLLLLLLLLEYKHFKSSTKKQIYALLSLLARSVDKTSKTNNDIFSTLHAPLFTIVITLAHSYFFISQHLQTRPRSERPAHRPSRWMESKFIQIVRIMELKS